MLLPFQGANGGVVSYPGCRSLWSLALGWEVLPFQGANGGVSFVVKLNWLFVVIAIVMTLVIHLIANTGAYLLGMKDVWY